MNAVLVNALGAAVVDERDGERAAVARGNDARRRGGGDPVAIRR